MNIMQRCHSFSETAKLIDHKIQAALFTLYNSINLRANLLAVHFRCYTSYIDATATLQLSISFGFYISLRFFYCSLRILAFFYCLISLLFKMFDLHNQIFPRSVLQCWQITYTYKKCQAQVIVT